jgi:hypothetical protein
MNCPECNKNNQYQNKTVIPMAVEPVGNMCPLCKYERKVSWHRYLQYQLGWVLLYSWDSVTYEKNLLITYERLCVEHHKKGRMKFIPYPDHSRGSYEDARGFNQNHDVLKYYCNQLKSSDMKVF